jgi:ribosomal protein S12 methylthiotransferase accessory factor
MEITITFPGGKKVEAEFQNGLKVVTDQPVKAGGEDSAPSPYQLFLASLGTCAGFYVLSFCQNKHIPLEGVKLVQHHESVPIGAGQFKLSKIIIEIIVPPEFPEKYHDALVRVAEQCAVKKTLFDPPIVEALTTVNGK